MAIICRDHRLLFIMVPGTGCSVVGNLLIERFGGEWLPEETIRRNGHVVVQRKHNSLDDILNHGLLSRNEVKDYLVCATIRNPFDRWVTYYQRYVGEWIDSYHGYVTRRLSRLESKVDFDRSRLEIEKKAHELEMERHRKRRQIIRAMGFNPWMTGTLMRWYWAGRKAGYDEPLLPYAFPMLTGVDVAMRQEQLEESLNHVLRMVGIQSRVQLPRKNITEGKKHYTEYWSAPTRYLGEKMLGTLPQRFGYRFEGVSSTQPVVELNEVPVGKAIPASLGSDLDC